MIVSDRTRLYNLANWSYMEDDGDGYIEVHVPGVSVSIHIPSADYPSKAVLAEVIRMNSEASRTFTMAEVGELYALWAEARKGGQ